MPWAVASARFLESHTAAFNSNRWVFSSDAEVIYRHSLSNTKQCVDFFSNYALARLQHWRDHEAVKTVDVATLSPERERILVAMIVGFHSLGTAPFASQLTQQQPDRIFH